MCFPTPTLERAQQHPKGYYDWMLNGMALYDALEDSHPRLKDSARIRRQAYSFETYPYAITKAFFGKAVSAKLKRAQRAKLLAHLGIDLSPLRNIDWIDAACCALTARKLQTQTTDCTIHGNAQSGFLIVPSEQKLKLKV